MSFDKFKNIRPKSADIQTDDADYLKTLANLPEPAPKRNIIPIIGTVAAAVLVVVGVSIWAIIGRGVRSTKPNNDDIIIKPAYESDNPERDETSNDEVLGENDAQSENDIPTEDNTDIKPAVNFEEYTKRDAGTLELMEKGKEIYINYCVPMLPTFELGQVPTKESLISYCEFIRPELCTDGELTGAELNSFALEYFGLTTAFVQGKVYPDGLPEIGIELSDPVVSIMRTAVSDNGKPLVTLGYANEIGAARHLWVTYVPKENGLDVDYFVAAREKDYYESTISINEDASFYTGDEFEFEFNDKSAAQLIQTLFIENKVHHLPLFEINQNPGRMEILNYAKSMGITFSSAEQANAYLSEKFYINDKLYEGVLQYDNSFSPKAIDASEVEIISAEKINPRWDLRGFKVMYTYGGSGYQLTYVSPTGTAPTVFLKHTKMDVYPKRTVYKTIQADFTSQQYTTDILLDDKTRSDFEQLLLDKYHIPDLPLFYPKQSLTKQQITDYMHIMQPGLKTADEMNEFANEHFGVYGLFWEDIAYSDQAPNNTDYSGFELIKAEKYHYDDTVFSYRVRYKYNGKYFEVSYLPTEDGDVDYFLWHEEYIISSGVGEEAVE